MKGVTRVKAAAADVDGLHFRQVFHQKLFIHNFCHTHRLAEEKTTLLKECEDSVSLKAEETEQLRLRLEEAQQELLLANNQV